MRPTPSLNPVKGVIGSLLAALALAMPPARAELRGKVHRLVNPEAPRLEWRRVPLPGAYIAVFWSITVPAPAHAISSCRYSEFARSDDRGEYIMEGPNFVTAGLAQTSFLVYSPGLEPINFPYGGSVQSAKDITMAKSTLAPGERLSRVAGYTDPHCPDTKLNDPRRLLDAFHRGLLDEARSLQVESDEGRRHLQSIEAAARKVSGLDEPGAIRAVIMPSSDSIRSSPRIPDAGP
jgi:hypothetical protein